MRIDFAVGKGDRYMYSYFRTHDGSQIDLPVASWRVPLKLSKELTIRVADGLSNGDVRCERVQ